MLIAAIKDWVRDFFRESVWRGTVAGTSGNLVTVTRPNQGNQNYPKLASYTTPQNGDEVLVIRLGEGWIVAGKVTR